MSPLPSSDIRSKNSVAPLPADAFDCQTAKAGIKRFAALWPLMPPVALFGIAFAFIGAPLPSPIGSSTSAASTSVTSASDWVVPASETMIVAKQAASGYALLRGRLRAPQGDVITSPSRGQVARVMARIGQVVKLGDPLVMISRGTIDAPQSNSPLERWQTQAENAQIAAARQQEALENRMSSANERLQAAQARVAAAQARVADARALIKRLQNGEEVSRGEVNSAAEAPEPTATERQPEKPRQNEKLAVAARAAAVRENQQLQKTADAAEAKAKAANSAAKKAGGEVNEKRSQLKEALAALASAKAVKVPPAKAPDADAPEDGASPAAAPRPSTPDTTAEAKAVSDARSALATASSRAAALNREAAKLQARATELRGSANDSARRAMQSLQVFENESAAANPPTRIAKDTAPRATNTSGGDKITIADAARIARDAMKESDAAIADADRIRREVKGYERPVSGTMQRVDDATRRLQSAQQQIWNTAGAARPNITIVSAPAGGTVLSLAGMTNEVNAGQAIATIGRPDRLEVSIQDTSGAWKSLTPNARILAIVKTNGQNASASLAPATTPIDKSTPALARSTGMLPSVTSPAMNGTPTVARVIAIAPPTKAGGPATIRIAVHNPPRSGSANLNGMAPRAFTPGMGVLFSIAKPGKRVMISLPAASIRRDKASGKPFVAVLAPLPETDGLQPTSSSCRVEWRAVEVGTGDGVNNQILTGLEPGERVALRPDALYNFTRAYGAQATVRVEQT